MQGCILEDVYSPHRHTVHGESRQEKKVPPTGTPPSCQRKRYTFQTRIMLFYARGVPIYLLTYLSIYGHHCSTANFPSDSRSSLLHTLRSLAYYKNYSCICIYLMTSDDVRNRKMVFFEQMRS